MKLEVQNVVAGYGNRIVLHSVSFEVGAGEILCLLGPNGSGKSTLFKAVLGLLSLKKGQVLVNRHNIGIWPRAKIAKIIGYIPQAHIPPFPFKALDIVLMGRTAHLGAFVSPSKQDVVIARKAMATLNIGHFEDKIYTEMSGGERQLVLIARALAQEPRFLIMDEPTNNLDFGNQVLVLSHIQKLAKMGLGIIMASHFPEHAFLYASKTLLLKKGQVYAAGTPDEIVTEGNLRYLYGVGVRIVSAAYREGDERIKICIPEAS